ncbi:HNH endonuclease [Sphingomonas sp.]|uniref:HNH endonuclease n=1 Tax=Sphingomonas sp. TaxID=28214 RepID=UPI0035A8AC4E
MTAQTYQVGSALSPQLRDLFITTLERDSYHHPAHRPVTQNPRVARLLAVQGDRCALCGKVMSITRSAASPQAASVDHVTPRAKGGARFRNSLLAHRSCNSVKGDRMPYPCELLFLEAINLKLGVM